MRAGQLRTLIRDLRAGGVSEYTETSPKGVVITLKLGAIPAERSTSDRSAAKAAKTTDAEAARKRLEMLAELGTDEAGLAKALENIT